MTESAEAPDLAPSSSRPDYSLRQNKSIERQLVFSGMRSIIQACRLENLVYVGLGSVWFTDFHLAHRELGIDTMISVECDDVTFSRAKFNRPYRTVEVIEGYSDQVVPNLLERSDLKGRPWVVWLDYDKALDETRRDELARMIRTLPDDSFLVTTFSATGKPYGAPATRQLGLQARFGAAVPDGLLISDLKDEATFSKILAQATENWMASTALSAGRDMGLLPAFRIAYRDGAPMVTAGGFLPSPASITSASAMLGSANWPGRPADVIATPPLTVKEVLCLRALLPSATALTRDEVRAAGFDLEDAHIRSFETHYQQYPWFAQIAQ